MINDRDASLSGLLADGSGFEFELRFFDPDATLTVTLVQHGDTDADGLVNIDNLNNVRNNFGETGNADGTLPGDAVPWDGLVNVDDLNAVRNNFGAGTTTTVPEPSTAFSAPAGSHAPGSDSLTLARKARHVARHLRPISFDLVTV